MSATEERREEEESPALARLLAEAEEQLKEGRADPGLLREVSRLRPEDAYYLVYRLEKWLLGGEGWHYLSRKSFEALSKVEGAALPRVAEYARRRLGIEAPLLAARGWTDEVVEALRGLPVVESFEEGRRRGLGEYVVSSGDDYVRAVVSWGRLKGLLGRVPAQNLLSRKNKSPRFLDFIEVVANVRGAYLAIYVVGKESEEGLMIDGVLLPAGVDAGEAVKELLVRALGPPDEVKFFVFRGRQYIWLWWED